MKAKRNIPLVLYTFFLSIFVVFTRACLFLKLFIFALEFLMCCFVLVACHDLDCKRGALVSGLRCFTSLLAYVLYIKGYIQFGL